MVLHIGIAQYQLYYISKPQVISRVSCHNTILFGLSDTRDKDNVINLLLQQIKLKSIFITPDTTTKW